MVNYYYVCILIYKVIFSVNVWLSLLYKKYEIPAIALKLRSKSNFELKYVRNPPFSYTTFKIHLSVKICSKSIFQLKYVRNPPVSYTSFEIHLSLKVCSKWPISYITFCPSNSRKIWTIDVIIRIKVRLRFLVFAVGIVWENKQNGNNFSPAATCTSGLGINKWEPEEGLYIFSR